MPVHPGGDKLFTEARPTGDTHLPSAITSPTETSTDTSSHTTIQELPPAAESNFLKFGLLPLETQFRILEFALAAPRIVKIRETTQDGPAPNIGVFSPYPPLLQVCQMFREEVREKYSQSFAITANGVTSRSVYFNFESDILLIHQQVLEWPEVTLQIGGWKNVQRLSIVWHEFFNRCSAIRLERLKSLPEPVVVLERRMIRECVKEQAFLVPLHRARPRHHEHLLRGLGFIIESSRRRERRYRFVDSRIVCQDPVELALRERTFVQETVAGIFSKRVWMSNPSSREVTLI